MKLNFSLKNKEASMEADIEGIVEKSLAYKSGRPEKKTRYQIKQEEKRKNEAAKHKQQMIYLFVMGGFMILLIGFCIIAAVMES